MTWENKSWERMIYRQILDEINAADLSAFMGWGNPRRQYVGGRLNFHVHSKRFPNADIYVDPDMLGDDGKYGVFHYSSIPLFQLPEQDSVIWVFYLTTFFRTLEHQVLNFVNS